MPGPCINPDLTPQQFRVLLFILERHARCQPVTIPAMMAHFGWKSSNAPTEHLARLRTLGLISDDGGEPRRYATTIPRCTLEILAS